MRARRATPRRRTAPRWSAQQWELATLKLYARARGKCEWCGTALHGSAERHHRKRRRDGGDTYSNVLLLHPRCHSDVHAQVEAARTRGAIVPTWADPSETPVLAWGKLIALLDDEGAVHPLT